jgi:hypothetical protein
MTKIFYFFVNSAIDDEPCTEPIITDEFLGDIGDYIEFDGAGYYIRDYAIEDYYQDRDYAIENCYPNKYFEY